MRYFIAFLGVLMGLIVLWHIDARINPAPDRCRIIDGREIVTHNCIPYCPPDPKECG